MIFTQHASKGHAYRTKIKELLSDVMKLKRREKSAVLGSLRELRTRLLLGYLNWVLRCSKTKKKKRGVCKCHCPGGHTGGGGAFTERTANSKLTRDSLKAHLRQQEERMSARALKSGFLGSLLGDQERPRRLR